MLNSRDHSLNIIEKILKIYELFSFSLSKYQLKPIQFCMSF